MSYYLLLNFSKEEYISIEIPCKESELYRYDEVMVFFNEYHHNTYDLLDDYLIEALRLNLLLEKALINELELHDSINEDIGYMWNKYLYQRKECEEDVVKRSTLMWGGERYNIWSSSRNCKTHCETWLYQKEGKTYFEITPLYPWHFDDPKEGEQFVSYDEFMKHYKPYVIRELAQETVKQWAQQTQKWLKIIKDNDAKYLNSPGALRE